MIILTLLTLSVSIPKKLTYIIPNQRDNIIKSDFTKGIEDLVYPKRAKMDKTSKPEGPAIKTHNKFDFQKGTIP